VRITSRFERLLDEVKRLLADRAHEVCVGLGQPGHQDHVQLRALRLQARHDFKSVRAWHRDIADDQVRANLALDLEHARRRIKRSDVVIG
jgi:hypothetical protein